MFAVNILGEKSMKEKNIHITLILIGLITFMVINQGYSQSISSSTTTRNGTSSVPKKTYEPDKMSREYKYLEKKRNSLDNDLDEKSKEISEYKIRMKDSSNPFVRWKTRMDIQQKVEEVDASKKQYNDVENRLYEMRRKADKKTFESKPQDSKRTDERESIRYSPAPRTYQSGADKSKDDRNTDRIRIDKEKDQSEREKKSPIIIFTR